MTHDNIISTVDGHPWALTEQAMGQMQTFIQSMSVSDLIDVRAATKNRGVPQKLEDETYRVENGIAMVPVYGKMFPRANTQMQVSGGTSMNVLNKTLKEVEGREDVKGAVLVFDSPGGSVKGVERVTNTLRGMETQTTAFAQGTMASAAYWIGSAADKVVANATSLVGSIGVYKTLVSKHDKMEEEGLNVEVVRSAPKKALGNEMEPNNEESVKAVQRMVDKIHAEFVATVAQNRNLSEKYVNDTMADGDVKVGSEATDDFVDEVATLDEVLADFDLDVNASETETEQAYAFLTDRYEALASRHQKAVDTVEAQAEKIKELRAEVNKLEQEGLQAEIDQVIETAVYEEEKIAPGRADEARERIETREDLDQFRATLDLIEPGAAGPSESLDTPNESNEPADQTQAMEALADQGFSIAESEKMAQQYEQYGWKEGEDFVRAENAIEVAEDLDLV